MVWYKVKWIDPLFAAFDALFPGRPRGSDGTIGDTAHQAETSGHNPDDTPGVRAERSDADTKPEVRAADVTTVPGGAVAMQRVIDAVLRTPADRDRFIYIIFNRTIWRASNGWRQESYSGSDPHTGHAHFSGDPASDENGAPFTSILQLGEDDDMNFSDPSPWEQQFTTEEWDGGLWLGGTVGNQLQYVREGVHFTRKMVLGLTEQVAALGAGLKAIAERVDVDPAELAAIEEAARRGAASAAVDVQALASALAPLLGVDQAVVVGALESPEGQAALTAAANRAEDS